MEDQILSDRIHAAYDVEVEPGSFDRLRVALESAGSARAHHRGSAVAVRRLAPLVAGLVVTAITASIVVYAVGRRVSPANNPPPAVAVRPIINWSFFSAQDAAVQLEPPSPPAQSDRAPLLITHDGGRTWIHTPLDFPQINLRWIDARHLVAAMGTIGPPNEVVSSSDGGLTWRVKSVTTVRETPTWQPASIFMLNENEGWSLCMTETNAPCTEGQSAATYATLSHTVDGGATWQQISTLPSSDGVVPLTLFFFTDSNHGFMSTRSDERAALLSTVDGGKTWREIPLPAPAVDVGGVDATSIDCGSATCVVDPTMFGMSGVVTVVSRGHAPYTLTTEDGGLTWSSPHRMPFASPTAMPTPWLAPLNATEWWTVDAAGSLYRTLDAGVTWQRVAATLPRDYELDSVQPGENGVLWGATRYARSGPFPLRSTDGGLTWSLVKLPKP